MLVAPQFLWAMLDRCYSAATERDELRARIATARNINGWAERDELRARIERVKAVRDSLALTPASYGYKVIARDLSRALNPENPK